MVRNGFVFAEEKPQFPIAVEYTICIWCYSQCPCGGHVAIEHSIQIISLLFANFVRYVFLVLSSSRSARCEPLHSYRVNKNHWMASSHTYEDIVSQIYISQKPQQRWNGCNHICNHRKNIESSEEILLWQESDAIWYQSNPMLHLMHHLRRCVYEYLRTSFDLCVYALALSSTLMHISHICRFSCSMKS